jgi:hypothetical protein
MEEPVLEEVRNAVSESEDDDKIYFIISEERLERRHSNSAARLGLLPRVSTEVLSKSISSEETKAGLGGNELKPTCKHGRVHTRQLDSSGIVGGSP